MRYTLITAKGKLYTFFVLAVAETYQQAYGGTLFDNSVVQTAEVVL
jgi:predicted DNA-binding protein with PD1-like motif